jgi:hypothetical protein
VLNAFGIVLDALSRVLGAVSIELDAVRILVDALGIEVEAPISKLRGAGIGPDAPIPIPNGALAHPDTARTANLPADSRFSHRHIDCTGFARGTSSNLLCSARRIGTFRSGDIAFVRWERGRSVGMGRV